MQAALQAEPAPTGGDEDLEAEAALADVLRQEQEVREAGGPTQPGAAAAPEWAPPPGAQEGAELKELREKLASKTREAEHATQLLKEEVADLTPSREELDTRYDPKSEPTRVKRGNWYYVQK